MGEGIKKIVKILVLGLRYRRFWLKFWGYEGQLLRLPQAASGPPLRYSLRIWLKLFRDCQDAKILETGFLFDWTGDFG